jgi:hypothetical protein
VSSPRASGGLGGQHRARLADPLDYGCGKCVDGWRGSGVVLDPRAEPFGWLDALDLVGKAVDGCALRQVDEGGGAVEKPSA